MWRFLRQIGSRVREEAAEPQRVGDGPDMKTLSDASTQRNQRESRTRALVDPHGQPVNRRYAAARLSDRAIDELIGLSRGVIADGVVTQSEAEFLARWLDKNRHIREEWPASVLYSRISEMLSDGVLDTDEQHELLALLSEVTGEGESLRHDVASLSTQLPLTRPPPEVRFEDHEFCLTGRFVHGTRKECEAEIVSRGGRTKPSPTLSTNYLVVGFIGSTDWIHSTHGRKIERAVEYAKRGSGIFVISEEHWSASIASL